MKKTVFTGMATAIVTPLTRDGIDYDAFARLLDWQIAEGIDGVVVCGTTGESSTLTDDEHRDAISFAVKHVAGRIPVIAGTGSNDTDYALELTRHACEAGVDGVLTVTPYYNKATQNGLIKMFGALADAATAPVILYNVPSRTGVNIEPKTAAALAEHPNISAIKEASGNISQIAEIAALCGDKLDIYSGNDDQTLPIMALGGKSTLICKKFFEGDIKGATALQFELLPLINALFSEVNPIPVKAAMAAMGYCEDYLRLPLTPMEEAHKAVLLEEMRKQGLNV